MQTGALAELDPRLCNGAMACNLDAGTGGCSLNAHGTMPTLAAQADEFAGRPLKPHGHDITIVVPEIAEAHPISCVAPGDPIPEHIGDDLFLCRFSSHLGSSYSNACRCHTHARPLSSSV